MFAKIVEFGVYRDQEFTICLSDFEGDIRLRFPKKPSDKADALRNCLDDKSPYVQIAGAYALAKYGDGKDVRKATDHLLSLTAWTEDRSVFVALTALNAVDKLDGKAAHALEQIKTLPRNGGASPDGRYNGYVNQVLGKVIQDLGN